LGLGVTSASSGEAAGLAVVMGCGWDGEVALTAVVEDGAIYMEVPVRIGRGHRSGSNFFSFLFSWKG